MHRWRKKSSANLKPTRDELVQPEPVPTLQLPALSSFRTSLILRELKCFSIALRVC